jgi:hypothetical protein
LLRLAMESADRRVVVRDLRPRGLSSSIAVLAIATTAARSTNRDSEPETLYLEVRHMQTQRTRSAAVLASPPLALVIAREIELLATRRGRLVAFDVEEIAELVASARPKVGLIDARELAEELGVARDWVYANAERLGGVRLGNGPRARLRFDVELARQALAAGGNGAQPPSNGAAPRRRGRPRREVVPAGVPLIQGRSGR